MNLGRVLEDATAALSRLDADRLDELQTRALALRDTLAGGARMAAVPELTARFRVFANVVKATGKNLEILQRAGAPAAKRVERTGVCWVL